MSVAQGDVPLLERDSELASFEAALVSARSGLGSVVLVSGEAGIGKSSLVRAAERRARTAGVRVLRAACDHLIASRALGPLRDLADTSAGPLRAALNGNPDREELLAALRQELSVRPNPTLLIIEDVQWADDATVDVLAWLTRRVATLPSCVALTYRSQDIDASHPFRRVLGRLADVPVVRLPLAPLSEDAVRSLVGGAADVDVRALHDRTGGNPFFLTELLANSGSVVPPTVTEAVMSRVRLLSPAVQRVLEQVAVMPAGLTHDQAEILFSDAITALAEAESRGFLQSSKVRIAFQHELARRALLESLPESAVRLLHRRALEMLLKSDLLDSSLILHHADAIGDDDILIRFGPDAAREAAAASAHRQAVEHYRRLLRVADSFAVSMRVQLLEEFSVECFATGHPRWAVDAQQRAVALRRQRIDNPTELSMALRWLSRSHWYAGQYDASDEAAQEALDVLDEGSDLVAVGWAQSNAAHMAMLSDRDQDAEPLAERAVGTADASGDTALLVHAQNNLGVIRWRLGRPDEGAALLERSLQTALRHHLDDDACRAYVNWASCLIDDDRYREGEQKVVEGIAFADRVEQVSYLRFLQSVHAIVLLYTGRWAHAVTVAQRALAGPPDASTPFALVVVGTVRVRSGDESVQDVLEGALEFAEGTSLQRLVPVATMVAEQAWLRDRPADALEILDRAYRSAVARQHPLFIPELAYWRWKLGIDESAPMGNDPFDVQRAGQPQTAAARWKARDRPYEQVRALLETGEPDALRTAVDIADRLGAQPLGRRIRAALRAAGITPTPAPRTRGNPSGLTDRQLEILALLQEGMTNAEIAARLVISVRTVDHHVAAVLTKLGVSTRRAAARLAMDVLQNQAKPASYESRSR